VKYCQKVTLFQISGEKFLYFQKQVAKILPSFNLFGRVPPSHACLLATHVMVQYKIVASFKKRSLLKKEKTRNKINGLEVLILMLSTYW
jgi:hypothetical protein